MTIFYPEETRLKDTMVDAIIKHAGLSDWDRESVECEVDSILIALKRKGFQIIAGSSDNE